MWWKWEASLCFLKQGYCCVLCFSVMLRSVCFSLLVEKSNEQIAGKPSVIRHQDGARRGGIKIQLKSTNRSMHSESWMQEYCITPYFTPVWRISYKLIWRRKISNKQLLNSFCTKAVLGEVLVLTGSEESNPSQRQKQWDRAFPFLQGKRYCCWSRKSIRS